MIAAAIFTMNSCKKEEIQTVRKQQNKGVLKATSGTNSVVDITASTGYICGLRTPCGLQSEMSTRNNSINVTNNNPSAFPNLVYTFYRKWAEDSFGNPIYTPYPNAQYQCNGLNSAYAQTFMSNNVPVLVLATPAGQTPPDMNQKLIYYVAGSELDVYDPAAGYPPYNPGYSFDYEMLTLGAFKGLQCSGDTPPSDL